MSIHRFSHRNVLNPKGLPTVGVRLIGVKPPAAFARSGSPCSNCDGSPTWGGASR
jgi:hypothetical protein